MARIPFRPLEGAKSPIQSRRPRPPRHDALHVHEVYTNSDIPGTVRVITARELVVLSRSFTSHSTSVKRHRHFVCSCKPRDIHNLYCERGRNKPPRASPATGFELGAAGVTGAHATAAPLLHSTSTSLWETCPDTSADMCTEPCSSSLLASRLSTGRLKKTLISPTMRQTVWTSNEST